MLVTTQIAASDKFLYCLTNNGTIYRWNEEEQDWDWMPSPEKALERKKGMQKLMEIWEEYRKHSIHGIDMRSQYYVYQHAHEAMAACIHTYDLSKLVSMRRR